MKIYVSELPWRRVSNAYLGAVTVDRSFRREVIGMYRTLRAAGVPSYVARWRITRLLRAGQQSTTTRRGGNNVDV